MENKNKIYSIFSELVLEAESREEARGLADRILAMHGLYYRINKCIKDGSKGIRDFLRGYTYNECILCGDEPFIIGIFVPNSKSKDEFCSPDNKEQCIPYPLCEKCYKQPEKDRTEKVENKLKSMMKEMKSKKEKKDERR